MTSDFPDFFQRTYVVSLPNSADRRAHIAAHFAEIGLSQYEFFDATPAESERVSALFASGSVAKYPPCFRCGKTDCGNPTCNNVLIAPQVAVFDTYLRLWRRIVQENQCALVCEDDVLFNPWWRETFQKISEAIREKRLVFERPTPSLLRLGWAKNAEHSPDVAFRIDASVRMSNPCHAITPSYAQALLNEHGRIANTVDVFQHQLASVAKKHALTVFPPAAHELSWSTGTLPSLIHPKDNHTSFLRGQGRQSEADAHDARVRSHLKHMYYRPMLIVGHPRCGTGYATQLLRQLGLDIGHENDGKDGLSSWMFAAEEDAPYAQAPVARTRRALAWDHLLMPVRDIATAVPSIMRENIFAPPSYDYRRKNIMRSFGIDLNHFPTNFARAVASYLYWNQMILALGPNLVFRVEADSEEVRRYIGNGFPSVLPCAHQLDTRPTNANKPYKGVRYEKPQISPQDWASLPQILWEKVQQACERFGYDIPKRQARNKNEDLQPVVDLTLLDDQFCRPSGWARSRVEQRPVRADGSPLPWFTYGAIEFLLRAIRTSDRVFEYGAGYGTLWWKARVETVVSVGHDASWCEQMAPRLSDNVTLLNIGASSVAPETASSICDSFFRRMRRTSWPDYPPEKIVLFGLDDENFKTYAASICGRSEKFDIIVIGGMARRLCAAFAVEKISGKGMIILDDSNRGDYDAAYDILQEAGFCQIPFWGLAPGANFLTCTSVFVRSLDRLPSARHTTNSLSLPEY